MTTGVSVVVASFPSGPDAATAMCRKEEVRFNIENRPEKGAEDIRAKIGGARLPWRVR